LKKWILYVYENTPESSKIRKFIPRFFHYCLRFSKTGLSSEMRQQLNSPQYGIDEMHRFAPEIPDLIRDVFVDMRPTNEYYLSTFLEPWSIRPCVFHTHPEDEWELECPMSLCFELETYPDPLPRVQYFFSRDDLERNSYLLCTTGCWRTSHRRKEG
jgi:hypothetical protein